jgi:type I restriction enzyme, S subunit
MLDDVFAGLATAITNTEKNLKNSRELFDSYLNSIFDQQQIADDKERSGWDRVCIRDVCESIVDCPNRTAPKLDRPSPYKMIRTTNVRDGRIGLQDVNFVSEEVYRRWTRRQVPQRGDVILTREAPLGEVGMLCTDDKVFLGQRLVSYRAEPSKLNNHFLLFAFQYRDLKRQIQRFGSGATVQHMRVPDSKALLLNLPPLAIQQGVVDQLNALLASSDQLEANYTQKLDRLAQLRRSILQRAFAGSLDSLSSSSLHEAAE